MSHKKWTKYKKNIENQFDFENEDVKVYIY